jgi:hypothetical protein
MQKKMLGLLAESDYVSITGWPRFNGRHTHSLERGSAVGGNEMDTDNRYELIADPCIGDGVSGSRYGKT